MRRRYLKVQPALAHWFGIRAWELELLTQDEVDEYVAQIPKPPPVPRPAPMRRR